MYPQLCNPNRTAPRSAHCSLLGNKNCSTQLTQYGLVRRDIDAFHDEADIAEGGIRQHGQHGLRTAISQKREGGEALSRSALTNI